MSMYNGVENIKAVINGCYSLRMQCSFLHEIFMNPLSLKHQSVEWRSTIKHSGLRHNYTIQFCSYISDYHPTVIQYEALLKSSGLGLVNTEKKCMYLNRLQELMWTDGRTNLPCQSRVARSWRAEWEPLTLIVLPRSEALRHTTIVYIYCYYLNKKGIRSPRMGSL
jgi:hypothetical protein